MQNGTLLAAVDLGSNSFRLEIGRLERGGIRRTDYLKETVRQGSGLDADRNLTLEAMERGWECLARFAERLAGFKKRHVRAVATQTLREARNRDEFLTKAHKILDFPIDVIPGREEARLIYQGVAHLLPQSEEARLVVDIGGRSTEMILGRGMQALATESYRVGSVAWSMRYFPEGQLSVRAFEKAEVAAKAVLDESVNAYHAGAWTVAYGSSGTIGAVADILAAAGEKQGLVTREGLDWLVERLVRAQSADRLKLDGMKDDRRAVIGGGVSVLRAVFDLLGIKEMQAAQGALRHGVLYELLDRGHEVNDLRAVTVDNLAQKFDADALQGERVCQVAKQLLSMAGSGMRRADLEHFQCQLAWAAKLHEIGRHISHSDYHKHGAYILSNADAPGFSWPELQNLSELLLGHRGKLRKLGSKLEERGFVVQLLCMRLAVIFSHARRDPDLRNLRLSSSAEPERQFLLECRSGWSEEFPQSAHLLQEEAIAWEKTPWSLVISGLS